MRQKAFAYPQRRARAELVAKANREEKERQRLRASAATGAGAIFSYEGDLTQCQKYNMEDMQAAQPCIQLFVVQMNEEMKNLFKVGVGNGGGGKMTAAVARFSCVFARRCGGGHRAGWPTVAATGKAEAM
eukprot:8051908-Lingulodinium_polyedra.AAC.1